MADLPKERLDGSHAFEITGVDFCGPFFYKPEARNKAPIKCYVCVFICFATKAVNLELIKDLSTVSFLHGLKRNELLDLKRLFLSDDHQKAVLEYCLFEAIDWHFIPPRSPHFGGLWEAAVKTAKYHFYRAIGTSVLEFEELQNPADLDVLTPAHFLNGGPPASFAEPDVTQLKFDRLNGWQRVSYLQQIFWSRWKEEYITSLQQRSKWRTPKPS
ncbi:uncharacterized protein LOC121404484 [Drosophila obscura]|uniref:uncharacterized protein LOC121404484 n=1 Tax=Drosophila obscura TaxID=7282 RepID=UPI001BB1FF4D|nr:uncharacterized protein LOC121404484 [Drosophila obscura]